MKKDKVKEQKVEYEKPQVKTKYGRRLIVLVASGTAAVIGLVLLVTYFFNLNMVFGGLGLIFGAAGILTFKYYWSQERDTIVRLIGETPKEQVNSLCIYSDKVIFENVQDPKGFLWTCENDGKPYFVNWDNPVTKRLEPFVLPDQQYYDTTVFAERVLTLPAHRKIFTKKQDLFHKLRPVFLFVIAVALWILIMTTTGGGGG